MDAYRDGNAIIAPRRAEGPGVLGDGWVRLEPGTAEYAMWDEWLQARADAPAAGISRMLSGDAGDTRAPASSAPKGGQFAPGGGRVAGKGKPGAKPKPHPKTPPKPAGPLGWDGKTGAGYGIKGGDARVRTLQSVLNRFGLKDSSGQPLVIDGKFGPRTTSAVKKLQRAMGLEPTGVVTEDFIAKVSNAHSLAELRPPKDPTKPARKPARRRVRRSTDHLHELENGICRTCVAPMHVLDNGICTTCGDDGPKGEAARHLPGLHDQSSHGRRFNTPGDPKSGIKKALKAAEKPNAEPEKVEPKRAPTKRTPKAAARKTPAKKAQPPKRTPMEVPDRAKPFHRNLDGIEDLARAVEDGWPPKERKALTGGVSADTELETLKDGTKVVVKSGGNPDAEQGASLILRAIGLDAPRVYRNHRSEVNMDYVDDAKTFDQLVGAAAGDSRELAKLADRRTAAIDSDDGKLMGLGDLMTINGDRNDGNWMLTDAGKVIPIDHGHAFQSAFVGREGTRIRPQRINDKFTRHYIRAGDWGPNDLTPADVTEIRGRLEALRPDFQHMDKERWLDYALEVLNQLEPHAQGTRNLVAGVR